MNMSEQIDKIAPALVAIQEEMVAIKDADNPFFKSKYAPLDEILKSIRPALKANGLTIIQSMEASGREITCTTRIMHTTGQWIDSTFAIEADKGTPQGFGSAGTYARRYSLTAALSIATPGEDDDGNKAEKTTTKAQVKETAATELIKFKASALPKLLKYSAECIALAFEEVGAVSDKEEKEPMLVDLLAQVNSKEKLTNCGKRCKELQSEINSAVADNGE